MRIEHYFYLLPQLILIGGQMERRAAPDRAQRTFGGGLGLSTWGDFDQGWLTSE